MFSKRLFLYFYDFSTKHSYFRLLNCDVCRTLLVRYIASEFPTLRGYAILPREYFLLPVSP